jgi:ribosomal protein S18 acetylase RimI-like enzyme
MNLTQTKSPKESDWPWILEKHAETAWASLSPDIQKNISIEVVRENLSKQTDKLREEQGVSNRVFVAHTKKQGRVGYIWVGSFRNGFTGEQHAHIINIYVESGCQGKGIGAELRLLAEDWTRQQNFSELSLNVSSHNHRAIGLYGKMGFQNEVFYMAKQIE